MVTVVDQTFQYQPSHGDPATKPSSQGRPGYDCPRLIGEQDLEHGREGEKKERNQQPILPSTKYAPDLIDHDLTIMTH